MTTSRRTHPRILVASTPDGQYRAKQALSDDYDLHFVSTLREAETILNDEGANAFDMIICGVHFDDSQMFELLQFVRTVDHFDTLPFMVIQAQHGAVSVMKSVKSSAEKLGACGFLELQDMTPEKANRTLHRAVKQSLASSVQNKSKT